MFTTMVLFNADITYVFYKNWKFVLETLIIIILIILNTFQIFQNSKIYPNEWPTFTLSLFKRDF